MNFLARGHAKKMLASWQPLSFHTRKMCTSFQINARPAPGSPFHLAIPVHSIPDGKKVITMLLKSDVFLLFYFQTQFPP